MSIEKLSGAGPFYYEGNELGILLFHGGGGGTAADLKPLARDLHKEFGFTIKVPLLPGYGTSPTDLRKVEVSSWLDAILNEYELLKKKCTKIVIGGHSMGGILGFILASKIKVDGLISIATPIAIRGFLPKLAPIFSLFIKFHRIDSDTLRSESNNEWIGYDEIPLNIVSKINNLLKIMKNNLKQIECPVLLFQGRLDDQIAINSMEELYENIRSKIKRRVYLENNGHPILNCPDHNILVRDIISFINKNIWIS